MISAGKIALFCDREVKALGMRDRYGAGLYWVRRDDSLDILMFYLTEPTVPQRLRLHLYGDTPDGTIGCLVLETESPLALQTTVPGKLHRVPLTFEYDDILEYETNIEAYDHNVITL